MLVKIIPKQAGLKKYFVKNLLEEEECKNFTNLF